MSQPRGGYGPRKSRLCFSCSKKRTCYRFNVAGRVITRVTGVGALSRTPQPLCQECACEVFGTDHIEREIAAGRLLWKSQRPSQPPTAAQLSLAEEQQ